MNTQMQQANSNNEKPIEGSLVDISVPEGADIEASYASYVELTTSSGLTPQSREEYVKLLEAMKSLNGKTTDELAALAAPGLVDAFLSDNPTIIPTDVERKELERAMGEELLHPTLRGACPLKTNVTNEE